MQLIDISVSLSESLPSFFDDPPLVLAQNAGPFAVTSLSIGSHCGPHLDLPGSAARTVRLAWIRLRMVLYSKESP